MVDSILKIKEYNRFSKGIFGWVGYKTEIGFLLKMLRGLLGKQSGVFGNYLYIR